MQKELLLAGNKKASPLKEKLLTSLTKTTSYISVAQHNFFKLPKKALIS